MSDSIDRAAFLHIAAWLKFAAAAVVLVSGAYGLFLRLPFSSDSVSLYMNRVGSHLLPFIIVAAGILIIGLAVSRPARLGPNAYALAAAAAAASLSLAAVADLHAYRQLHPSFAAELRAIARFAPPPRVISQSTTTEVTATPSIETIWNIGGEPATVCTAAKASLAAWADTDTLQAADQPKPGCSFVARKGADQVKLNGVFIPNDNHVSLSLTLTRQN